MFEAVGAGVFRNFWLPLTMGRNKMALAGHPRQRETRLFEFWTRCNQKSAIIR